MNTARILAIAALVTGIAVLAISQLFVAMHLRSAAPLDGAHGNEAMLAFELARTPEQMAQVIGTDPPSADAVEIRNALDRADRLDFGYMAIYALFIALSCALAARMRGARWLRIGIGLGPVAALFDAGENLVLLQMTQTGADVAALLPKLCFRTMMKWELLAVTSALFAAAFLGDPRRWVKAIALLFVIANLAAGALLFPLPAKASPLLLYSIASVWLWQIGYAGRCALREPVH